MKINVAFVKPELVVDGILVIPITEEEAAKEKASYPKALNAAIENKDFKGELSQTLILYPEHNYSAKRIMYTGLGKKSEIDKEKLRRAYSTAAKAAKSLKASNFSIILPIIESIDSITVARCVTEGILLGAYTFTKYKSDKKDVSPDIKGISLILSSQSHVTDIKRSVEKTRVICENVNFTRNLVNENSKDKNSLVIENISRKIARTHKIRLTALTERELKRLGMNLILAVNSGSQKPPRLLIMSYHGNNKSKDRYVIAGKGIIFDSGGLNLKPTGFMETMKSDMAGAATVLGFIKLASELRLKMNIIAMMPLCENLIGSHSYKPGDVFMAYNKKNVEITNTDAEGRLILADTLAYASEKIKPKLMIDLATLTGACIVALGKLTAGLMTNNEEYANKLKQSSKETNELIWELPLSDDYKDLSKSSIADLANSSNSKGTAGAIEGGLFLKNFVGKTPWMHLDIAGPSYLDNDFNYMPKGGTGFGIRLLLDFFEKIQ